MKTLLVISVFAIILSLTAVAIPEAEAGRTFTLNKITCAQPLKGTWDAGTSTCTTSGSLTLRAEVTINIPSGVTLVITGSGSLYNYGTINNSGIITNNGTINVSNSGGTGIYNYYGTITNNSGGTITLSNTGGYGIYASIGTITNNGTICDANGDQSTLPGTTVGTVPTSGNAIVACV